MRKLLALGAISILTAGGVMAGVVFTVGQPQPLGSVAGVDDSYGTGVNSRGTVAGYGVTTDPFTFATTYTPLRSIGGGAPVPLAYADGWRFVVASDVSENDVVVGYGAKPGPCFGCSQYSAVMWDANGQFIPLGPYYDEANQYTASSAQAISSSGRYIAGHAVFPDNIGYATRWDAGVPEPLPAPCSTCESRTATGVNDAGDVVGSARDATGAELPVIWRNGTAQFLAMPAGLVPNQFSTSGRTRITENGEVFSSVSFVDAEGNRTWYAIRWDANGAASVISTLPSTEQNIAATGATGLVALLTCEPGCLYQLYFDGSYSPTWTSGNALYQAASGTTAPGTPSQAYLAGSFWDGMHDQMSRTLVSLNSEDVPPPINHAPVVTLPSSVNGQEGSLLAINGNVSDPDGPGPLTHEWDLDSDGVFEKSTPAPDVQITPANNGTVIVAFRATDGAGAKSQPAYTTVVVANVAPSVQPGSDIAANIGQSITLDARFTDPGADANWQYHVSWGDGTPASSGFMSSTNVPIAPSHTYAADGTYEVTISVTDKDGDTGNGTLHVTIANRAPIADAGGPYTGIEGSSLAFDGSHSSDPDGDAVSYAWDFGDGASATGAIASHKYADNGTYTATLTVTDSHGAGTSASVQVTIANVDPSLGPISRVPDGPISAGTVVTLSASFTDPGADANWQYRVDWGDGTPISSGFMSSTGVRISPSHTYAAIGTFVVTVSVSDKDGARGTSTLQVTIINRAPIAKAGGPYSGVEGSSIAFDGSASSDADGDALSYAWDFGDGASATGAKPSHTYTDNGTYTAKLTVTDSHDARTTATIQVTIANAAPVLGEISGIPEEPIQVGTPVTLTASFTDANPADVFVGAVQWDLASSFTTSGVITIAPTSNDAGRISATTTLPPGVYTVTLRVQDKDGGTGVSSTVPDYIVVFDPNGGFVTGGGWFWSPSGACRLTVACGGAQGKATFGFVSKYLKGATTPSGNTEFNFQAGNLRFSATENEWLVVSGWKAQYKGTGRINGSGEYGFMLTAIDGDEDSNGRSPDKFRIKIWNAATGAIVYDNQMGASDDMKFATTISGGSIQVHKP